MARIGLSRGEQEGYLKEITDRGTSRALEEDPERDLRSLRKANPGVNLPVLLKLARSRDICRVDNTPSRDSQYRLFKRHGLDKDNRPPEDCRKFESETINDLWQSDAAPVFWRCQYSGDARPPEEYWVI